MFELFFVVILALFIFVSHKYIKARQRLKRFQPIIDVEREASRIERANKSAKAEREKTEKEIEQASDEVERLQEQLRPLEDELDMQSFGLYEPKYDFENSEQYKTELSAIRREQKELIRRKTALLYPSNWTVNNSVRAGQKMVNEKIKLMLRAFNGECDSLIMKVKYNNIVSIERRIESLFNAVNRLGETMGCQITREYFNLKINELSLVHGFEEIKQEEKEEQRAIREQMREEERARKEIERERIKVEKEQARYQKALEKARRDVEQATGEKHSKLQSEIERLNELLAEAEANKERVKSRAEMTRSGYVYIISNIGSFGEDIYKIGMTRRLEPMDRVRELGDASVPFRFDVHAMIFSEDAPNLENELHSRFEQQRVNMVNNRKEFFRVSLHGIQKVILRHHPDAVFTMTAAAEEYRKTQAMRTT